MQLFQKHHLNFKTLSRSLLVVALYVLLAKIGLFFALKPTTITIFWPAGGFALAVLLLGGLKYLPGILLGGMIAGIMAGNSPWVGTMFGFADMVESFSAYWLLINRFNFNPSLESRQDFFKLVLLAAGISSAISTLIGPTALLVGNIIPFNLYPIICFRWWMGDVLGIAFITPLILIWKNPPQILTGKLNALEVLIIYASTLLVGQILFFDWLMGSDYETQSVSWLILLIIWAGFRSGKYNTSALQLIIFFEALWSASHGVGHYANDMVKSGFFNFWLFGMLQAVGGMAIAVMTDESRKIQKALMKTEFYQRALLDSFPFAVWLKDTDSRLLSVNKSFAVIFGAQNAAELVGKNDFDIAPNDLADSYREDDRIVLTSHQDKNVEEEILTGGVRKWFETYKAPVFDDKGSILGTVGFARDITERKQVEQQLIESEHRFRELFDNAPLPYQSLDIEGNLLDVNQAWLDLVGCSREEIIGQFFGNLMKEPSQSLVLETFSKLKQEGQVISPIFELVRRDTGKTRLIVVKGGIARDNQGRFQRTHCILMDITDQHNAAQKLKASEEKFRSIIEVSPVPMALNDEQMNITYLNPAFMKTFGYDVKDIPTLVDWWQKAYPDPDYRSWVKATWQEKFKQAEREDKPFLPMELSICAKEGTCKTVVISAAVIAGSEEHLVVLFDITERKRTDDYEQFRSRILEHLATNKPLSTILEALALGVEQLNSATLCSILLLDDEGKYFVRGIAPSLPDFYNEAIKGVEIGIGVGSCGTAAFSGKPVIVEDIATHPYWTPYKELAAKAGLAACWSQPLLSSLNQVLGTFAIYHREAITPVASDLYFLEQSARLASLAIERKQAENDLIRSELKFHTLYDSTSDAVLMLTEQGFFDCNEAAIKLYGCATREELCSYHPADLSPPKQLCGTDSMTLAKQYINTALKNDNTRFEWLHKRVDTGQPFIVEVLLSTMFLDGKLVLQGAVRDITLRKQNEIELRIAATAFESQEGMLVTDVNHNILRVNSAFTTITGYSAEDVLGKNPRVLQSGQHDENFYSAMWESINTTDSWQGEVWNRRKSGEVFPEHLSITAVKDQNSIISNYVATLTDITLRKEAVDKIEQLAFYDPLTGLPNRRLLQDRLKPALASSHRSGLKGALLFIDMDNFKTLNDTLGHDMGDLLLQQVATRLESCMREGDTVARLGGDEFVVMLEDLSEQTLEAATQTEVIGNKILTILNLPYQLTTHEYHSTPSIGAVLFNGQEELSEELLKQADIAMYQAKASGRNTLRFFDPQMQASITARVALEEDLRLALVEDQFILYYQPQVNHNRQIIGAEVLIRWQHPVRGLVSPVDFIPLAEESNLILTIGQWVLKTACVQIKNWESSVQTQHLQLAVNVSSRQFYQADFVEQVHQILSQNAINPDRLKLELTESLVLDDIDDTIIKMNELRKIGVRFSMDDFGTGYSSLSSLKKLPLDQLKIDQSFVRDISIDLDDTIIVETIIAMANKLKIEVIAEGVETEAQLAFLEQHDCQFFQGYLFSKPVSITQFELLLKTNSL